jgi:mannose-6-phosphate isomerase-like protein (cupin superfamily)
MKYVPKSKAVKFANSPTCTGFEYHMGDPELEGAIAIINGSYPEKGFVVNEVCKELLYVISGEGTFVTKDQTIKLQQGDQVLINKGELYGYKDAKDLTLLATCTPAWYPKQHKEIV